MPRARSTRRWLVAAVSTVLAVTLGAGALAVPASAAPVAGTAAVTADADVAPFAFPRGHTLVDAGVKGFLTQSADGSIRRFAWYGQDSGSGYDGYYTRLRSTRTDDYLVLVGHYQVTVRDLTTMSSFQVPLDGTTEYIGSAANAVFTTRGTVLREHTAEGGTVTVTGLPAGATNFVLLPATPGEARVHFAADGLGKWGTIDLATGAFKEVVLAPEVPKDAVVKAVSETHIALAKDTDGSQPTIFLVDRSTGAVQRIPVESTWGDHFQVGLVGGWVVYGETGGLYYGPGPLYALTAYNPVTHAKVKLLDHLTSTAAAPDGSLYVRGGSLTQGEGMYRITATGNDTPAVTLVATTGEPTALTITGDDVPATVDLDKNAGHTKFTWNLSRTGAEVTLTVRHTRTGQTQTLYDYPQSKASTTFDWQGEYNGDYTWKLTARPLNGLGPTATATGGFRAVRTPKPHDFDDNGAPDVLLRDGSGRLWRADTAYSTQLQARPRQQIGTGWQIYDRIEATGDLAGSTVGDLVARDTAGVLWLYQGNGRGGFGTRTKIGAGWNAYTQLAGGSDLTGDGRADLVATDKAGDLYLYKGTGGATAPFAPRKKIGYGWGTYNQLTAVGDIAGGPAGDLVARDAAGVLWLYLGKGDGTFAARTRIGGGWNTYQHLVGVGDANRDGRPDLVGFGPQREDYLYRGTGDWEAPFLGRELAGLTIAIGGGPYNSIA
ncbi:FG-GAP-like repeat-containing protein [Streptomyces sp. NK15101]|uniref:FG-GAP-like repeat-containing protein n=1 Tax=Streptomyces sp. NK15101 TaxID=2873261 RepID=UPI001CED485E|nr:FG-GAP-like repeat-containing protein [Streptomyces sp. NK15101]